MIKKYYFLFIIIMLFTQIIAQVAHYDSNSKDDEIKQSVYTFVNYLNNNDESASLFCINDVNDIISTKFDIEVKIIDIIFTNRTANAFCNLYLLKNRELCCQSIDTINLIYEGVWKVSDSSPFSKLLFMDSLEKNSIIENISTIESIENYVNQINEEDIVLSDKTLISKQFTSGIYEINSTVTDQNSYINIFNEGTTVDLALYWNVNDDSWTMFSIDPYKQRILYAKKNSNGTYSSIKSYGWNDGDICKFQRPVAIDVNHNGEIFVVDAGLNKIFKLQYSSSNNLITCNSAESIVDANYLTHPVDLDFYDDENDDDDYFVVADIGRHSISQFRRDGYLIREYTSYKFGSDPCFDIKTPIKVCADGISVGFIDNEDNKIIYGVPHGAPEFDCNFRPISLPNTTNPVDIGIIPGNILLIVDNELKMCHKISGLSGEYICSYNGFMNITQSIFTDPVRIPTIIDSEPGNDILDFFVNEIWSSSSGSQRFIPGTDAINLINCEYNDNFQFSCTLTDASIYKIYFDNVLIEESENNDGGSNIFALKNKDNVDYGNHEWKISYIPYWNDLYGDYTVQWQTKTISFEYSNLITISEDATWTGNIQINKNVLVNPNVTLTISPGSNIIIQNSRSIEIQGTLMAVGTPVNRITFDGGGELRFNSTQGARSQIKYCNLNNLFFGIFINNSSPIFQNTNISNSNVLGISVLGISYPDFSSIEITNCANGLFVDNPSGIYCDYTLISNNGPNHPDFYDTGGGIINYGDVYFRFSQISDNLGFGIYFSEESEGDLGQDADDGYGYNNIGNNLGYDILSVADYIPAMMNYWGDSDGPNEDKIVGDIEYEPFLEENDELPWSLDKKSESDVKDQVLKCYYAGVSEFNYGNYSVASDTFESIIDKYPESNFSKFSIARWIECKYRLNNKSLVVTKLLEKMDNTKNNNLINNINENLSHYYRRERLPHDALLSLDRLSKKDPFNRNYRFNQGFIYLDDIKDTASAIVCFNKFLNENPNDLRKIYILSILDKINSSISNNTLGISNNPLPTEYLLYPAYPNPFNPITNISFDLPEDTKLSLLIYNLIGQEVWSLNNRKNNYFLAGNYSIIWDGRDYNGNILPSGTYFVLLNTKDYRKVQKVILLK